MNANIQAKRVDAKVLPDRPGMLPRLRHGVVEFPVHHVRGGTSTGLVIWDRIAPRDAALREELLRHLMGVPLEGTKAGNKQITGLGRAIPTSNKVFFADIEPATGGGVQLLSTLAQLASDKAAIDWSVNCGNMSAALPVWALDTGLVQAMPGASTFEIDIRNTNTNVVAASRIAFKTDGLPEEATIPGVDGAWTGVDLFLNDPVGSKTGQLLPTGHAVDVIRGVRVSCVDVAVPMVIALASDFGHDVQERIDVLNADKKLMAELRAVWTEAGLRMKLKKRSGDLMTADEIANSETIPKVCLVGAPKNGGNITARYFTPQIGHGSMAVSGGCCLGAAALMPGTTAHEAARGLPAVGDNFAEVRVGVENPAGILDATIEARIAGGLLEVRKAAYKRNTQILLAGLVPLYHASSALRESFAKS